MQSEESKELYNITMGLLMDLKASNGCFFTQREYEENKGLISVIKMDFDKINLQV